MGKSRIIFEKGFRQPLFRDIDFSDLRWDTDSLSAGTTYKVSKDDMLYRKEVKPKHYMAHSVRKDTVETNERWVGKSYDGEINVIGVDDQEYNFVLRFENGHLVEIKQV